MAVRPGPKKAPRKVKAPRVISQKVEHVAELSLARRDGSGNLFEVIVDLGRNTVQVRQQTTPITFKGVDEVREGINDLVQFFTDAAAYIEANPGSILQYDEDEAETTEAAPEATPAA